MFALFFPGYIPRSGISGSYGNSVLTFGDTATLFSTLAAPVCIPASGAQRSLSPHPRNACYLWSFWGQPSWQMWGGISLWFWFASPWLVTLSIFSCACWPSVGLLWRNAYLGLLPFCGLGCLFSDVALSEVFVYLGNEASVDCIFCKYFLLFHRLCFRFIDGFLYCAKACKFD